jgi:hypothetical protein
MKVHFDDLENKKIHETHSKEEYDRSPIPVTKLGFKELLEIMNLKVELRNSGRLVSS